MLGRLRVPRLGRRLKQVGAASLAAALVVSTAPDALQTAVANGDTRTLSFVHTHTQERVTVTFKRDGRFDSEGLRRANQFLRDWRRNEVIDIDPRLLDLVWEVYRDVGGTEPIHLVSAYRSPNTNEMLRSRSSGVARESQHTRGKAMDFFIPGVPVQRIREKGMLRQKGGVGFYSGQNGFVHLDVGSVRAWPRLTREQLVRLFPNGETLHLPSDGPPLPGYAVARARIQNGGEASTLAFASPSGRGGDDSPTRADAAGGSGRGILAALFGGGEDRPAPAATPPSRRPARAEARTEVAALPERAAPPERERPERAAPATAVVDTAPIPLPLPRPATTGTFALASAPAEEREETTAAIPLPLPRPVQLASLGTAALEPTPAAPAPPARAMAVVPPSARAVAFVAPGLTGAALLPHLTVSDVRRAAVFRAAVAVPADFADAPDATPGFGRWRTARTDTFAGPAIRNLVAQRSL